MRAIQHHLPEPRHVEVSRAMVAASPAVAWAAARHFDAATVPWIRFLFGLRTLPDRLRGNEASVERLGVDSIAGGPSGFMILEERPGHEVVVGAVGRFWHLAIPFAEVAPEDFAGFAAPGWGKVAWSIGVEPFGGGSLITFEVRTTATDDASYRKLRRYYGVIGPFSRLIRAHLMASFSAELGVLPRPRDRERPLPGDDLLPDAPHVLTHATDIEAPPALVWPWLMQLGCDRGGWYSIDAFDHGGVPSVERLVPEWGTREVGDELAAAPGSDAGFVVRSVAPEEHLVIGATTERLGARVEMTWAFALEALGSDATHLSTRVRARGSPRWAAWLQGAVLYPPLHALMQRAELENLGRLAEREAALRHGPPRGPAAKAPPSPRADPDGVRAAASPSDGSATP